MSDPRLRQAEALMALQEFRKAAILLESILDDDPRNASVRELLERCRAGGDRFESPWSDELAEPLVDTNPLTGLGDEYRGWDAFRRRDYEAAKLHFCEALRIDPSNPSAKAGLVETIKAGNRFYRLLLRYFTWITGLSNQQRWGVILGLIAIYYILRDVRQAQPQLEPIITPLLIGYIAFGLITWLATPVSNLIVSFHRLGKYALSEDQMKGATLFGRLLLLGVTALGFWAILDEPIYQVIALLTGCLLIPSSQIYEIPQGRPRAIMSNYTFALGGLAVTIVAGILAADVGWLPFLVVQPLIRNGIGLFMLAAFLSQFLAIFLLNRRPTTEEERGA